MNLTRKVNGITKVLGADDSSYPSIHVHAILNLQKNDKVSTETSGSLYAGGFGSGNYRDYQKFEGILLQTV